MVCHDVGSSPGWHAQAPVGTDGEAALPLWQVCLEVALELVGGLVVDALPFERAILPGTPQASPLGVPVHSLQYRSSFTKVHDRDLGVSGRSESGRCGVCRAGLKQCRVHKSVADMNKPRSEENTRRHQPVTCHLMLCTVKTLLYHGTLSGRSCCCSVHGIS